MRSLAALAMAVASGCSGGGAVTAPPETATTTTTTTTTATSPPVTAPPAPVRITMPACGYGGSVPAVSVFVDVENDAPLHGVSFSFAIADPATHAVLGHSREPLSTVISPVDRGVLDFSTQGTAPFDGELAAGARTRLQHYAGIDELPASIGPIEIQLRMTTSDGQSFDATCTTEQMWPSS